MKKRNQNCWPIFLYGTRFFFFFISIGFTCNSPWANPENDHFWSAGRRPTFLGTVTKVKFSSLQTYGIPNIQHVFVTMVTGFEHEMLFKPINCTIQSKLIQNIKWNIVFSKRCKVTVIFFLVEYDFEYYTSLIKWFLCMILLIG